MTIRQAPQTHTTLRATGISAVLLLSLCCGTASAATESPAPCPEMDNYDGASLHDILDSDDITSPVIRTIDSSESLTSASVAGAHSKMSVVDNEKLASSEDSSARIAPVAKITTRLPGVPESDLPRFRRHMFRTDI